MRSIASFVSERLNAQVGRPGYMGAVIKDDSAKELAVVILFDIKGLEWLASTLPQDDSFTRELWRAVTAYEVERDTQKGER